jgi:UDP-N-acetylmuramate: L-alanyl-gamma-D-glutamyl-meso-diaminopimelate ligase
LIATSALAAGMAKVIVAVQASGRHQGRRRAIATNASVGRRQSCARVAAPLAHDHVNVFPTIESYLAPFHQLFDLVPRDGPIVAATSGDLSERFLAETKRDVVTFGLTRGDWRGENIEYGPVSRFTLTERGREIARVKTTQLGAHNIENMVGIGAFVLTQGLASVEQYTTAMASCRGVVRRLDRKSDHTSVQMFEGFGSSYDKAKSAIAAMKKHFAQRRLLVVFEPHTLDQNRRRRAPLPSDDRADKSDCIDTAHDR